MNTKMMKPLMTILSLLLLAFVIAGTDGTIRGKITDTDGNPLPGALVYIEDVNIGSVCDENGTFLLLNVPVGMHDVTIKLIGYQDVIVQDVEVLMDKTTWINQTLNSSKVKLEAITVTEEHKPVMRDLSTSQSTVMNEKMEALPIRDVQDAISLQSGVVKVESRSGGDAYRTPSVSCNTSMKGINSHGDEWDSIYLDYDFVQRDNNGNTEGYDIINENAFKDVLQYPLSTLSIDVDNASYANVRRYLMQNRQMPPVDAVRIEEMINYFTYDYPQPRGEDPFSITTEIAACPWNRHNQLVHIGLQGIERDYDELPPSNLVFLVDVSGSMNARNKLPLVQESLMKLVDEMDRNDRIAIVVYAGNAGLVLPSTPVRYKHDIMQAIGRLRAGGSTAGGAGIRLAYQVAEDNLIRRGNNRVILATDGDFNVGVSSDAEMVRLIEEHRDAGIFLTIAGFGMGNYKDNKMEKISNAGNGNYFYIDNSDEADKVFVREMRANMFTIAKDVKIQIEFNPEYVESYRLIGYENRLLADEDFNDDTKDAGELGAGHTVTALYEIVPAGKYRYNEPDIDELKYQESRVTRYAQRTNEVLTVKFRYKKPNGSKSILIEHVLHDEQMKFSRCSDNFRFAAAVAGFGMLLRNSEYAGNLTYDDVIHMARKARGRDEFGYRREFLEMVEICDEMDHHVNR